MDMKSLLVQVFTVRTFPSSSIIDFLHPGRIRRGHKSVEPHAPIRSYYRLPSLEPKIHSVERYPLSPRVRMETTAAESMSIDTVLKASITDEAV